MAKPRSRSPQSHRSDVLAALVRVYERGVIEKYLADHNGNVTATAKALGLTRRGLEKKMLAHGLREGAAELRAKAGIGGPRHS